MISSVCWVPRGVAKPVPERVEPTEEELQAAQNALAELGDDSGGVGDDDEDFEEDEEKDGDMDVEAEVAQAQAAAAALTNRGNTASGVAASLEDALRELDLDNYDADDDDPEAAMVGRILGAGERGGLAYYASNEEDPYITLNDSASEDEDLTLRPSDLLILAARHEDDVSSLEVWVYEEGQLLDGGLTTGANSYVHHDIMLPSFPLCVAWLDCDITGARPDGRANLVAIGSMDPGIDIWDLDVVDVVEPCCVLGGEERGAGSSQGKEEEPEEEGEAGAKKKKKKAKKKKKSKKALLADSHEDAVLGLAWNAEFRNVLASCSADSTVKVWDLAAQKCEHTLRHHKGKVQAVAWNPAEAPVLLSGAFDSTVCLTDMRQPSTASATWKVTSDVEAVCWLPHLPTSFLVSSEDGLVACFDARAGQGSKPLFHLSAHDKATCALSFCPAAEGLLATASTDKKVKLWDLTDQKPSLVATEDLKAGAVFTLSFCPDVPYLLGVGGSMGTLSMWDIRCNAAVAARYPQLLKLGNKQIHKEEAED